MRALVTDRLHGRGVPTRFARSKLSVAIATALSGIAPVHATGDMPADVRSGDMLEEVVVTARKRSENLQDVPQSIDVYTEKDLKNLAITRFEDYATKTPSMSFISIGPGTQQFFMRGVSDGSNPNVSNTSSTGFFVDDMSMSYYGSIPDLHQYDIERIEILNGPQGTLYGAGAMSGAVRIVTKKPDLDSFSGGFDFDGGRIDGGGNNWIYEGYVNLPIVAGRTALRLSAFSTYDGGFINNLLTTRQWVNGVTSNNAAWAGNNYNTQHIEGGRAAIKQDIADGWDALLTYSYQGAHHKGAWDQDPTNFGARNVSRFGPENGNNYVKTLDFHVDGDVGIADLVFASTYWSQPSHSVDEYSNYVQYSTVAPFTAANIQSFACQTGPTIGGGTDNFSGCGVPTMYTVYDNKTERFSNELRLESKQGGRLHWLTGLYWEKTREKYSDFFLMPNIQPNGEAYQSQINYYNGLYAPAMATPLPQEWYSYVSRFDYLQVSEFGNATFDLTDRWSIELGLQHFQSGFSGSSLWAGYFWDPKTPSYYTGASNKWNTKAGVNFKVNKDLLLYASFGQGFRDGGVNSAGASCTANGVPNEYKPDTLNNFEIGWKSSEFDGHMTWNGALYYMPWKNYQTAVFDLAICPTTFNANIGNARIYGAESNVDIKLTENWSLQASGSYNDSHILTNTFDNPQFSVVPGERLPYVPYFNYSANIRYETPLGPSLKGHGQYDIAHKGDMWSDLRDTNPNGFGRTLQPSYEISNLRFGVDSAEDRWGVETYVSNLFNTRAVIFTNTGNYDHRQTTNLPRVFGVHLSYRFGKT
jgi:outer membrane receptor protein involved in Fe transport